MPSAWFQERRQVGLIRVDHVHLGASRALRLAPRRTAASTHLTFRPCSRCKGAQEAAASLTTLCGVLLDVLSADADRRGRADVGLRRHGRQVGGLADPDAGRTALAPSGET